MGGRNGRELRWLIRGESGTPHGAECSKAAARGEASALTRAVGVPPHWQPSVPQHSGLVLSGAGCWPVVCVPESRAIECDRKPAH